MPVGPSFSGCTPVASRSLRPPATVWLSPTLCHASPSLSTHYRNEFSPHANFAFRGYDRGGLKKLPPLDTAKAAAASANPTPSGVGSPKFSHCDRAVSISRRVRTSPRMEPSARRLPRSRAQLPTESRWRRGHLAHNTPFQKASGERSHNPFLASPCFPLYYTILVAL
jgi:hypothetical protein